MNEQMQKLIVNSCRHVPYYRAHSGQYIENGEVKSIHTLPLLTKQMMQAAPDAFISETVKKETLLSCHTSGSTGEPFMIFWDKSESLQSNLEVWKRRAKYGISVKSKACMFISGTINQSNGIPLANHISISPDGLKLLLGRCQFDTETLAFYYKQICDFQPAWIYGTPSVLLILAQYMANNFLKPPASLCYIECIGEYLQEQTKKQIECAFGMTVYNQYAMQETNGIAYACEQGNLHILDHNVYTEVVNEQGKVLPYGQEGEVCVTSLHNFAMPFIRYRTGDRGKLIPAQNCSCGCHSNILQLSCGRLNDMVYLPDGRYIDVFMFDFIISRINYYLNTIVQYQIYYRNHTFEIVYQINNQQLRDEVTELTLLEFENLGFDVGMFEIVYKDRILPNIESGKIRVLINESHAPAVCR